MAPILALADDLTGALEVGGRFAGSGLPTITTTDWQSAASNFAVIDTESRHLSATDSYSRILSIAANRNPEVIYKKTDSTLRGNIGPEMHALAVAYPGRPLIFIPAYPAMERTVRNGELLLDGHPLHETAFARDPTHPRTSSLVTEAIQGCRAAVEIVEAETEEEAEAATKAALDREAIVCGPGNIATYVATYLAALLEQPRQPAERCRQARQCLVVNGSLHERSAAQMRHAALHHCEGWQFLHNGFEQAQHVAQLWTWRAFDTLIVFGGDTVFRILEAMGVRKVVSVCELLPGIAVSLWEDLQLITKAGGFGPEDVLTEIRNRLPQDGN